MQGILRVAAAVPHLYLANVEKNVQTHLAMLQRAKEQQASLVVFPELSLTGATCGDLFFQHTLLAAARKGLDEIADRMPEGVTAVVGLPYGLRHRLYDCAAVVSRGRVAGLVPRQLLDGEARWFTPGDALENAWLDDDGYDDALLDAAQVFVSADGVKFAVEVGGDLSAPIPPSTLRALAGAEVIVNPAAVGEMVGWRAQREQSVSQQSQRCLCAYVHVSAGCGESTADALYAGFSMAAAGGRVLRRSEGFIADDYLMPVDIDIDRIRAARSRSAAWRSADAEAAECCLEETLLLPDEAAPCLHVPKLPFIPEEKAAREARCTEIFEMQAQSLARRMLLTGGKLVVGISGGLDSTLALLVGCRACDLLQLPRTNILGVTMPCFGTTDWTYQSALELMRTLGVTQQEIRIHESVRQHFRDIGHDEAQRDVTYENAQARERTQVLMDLSNQFGGIVLGTGDLSEIALGWCTYNGDHMSMYGVNSGVPKTLVRWVTRTVSTMPGFAESREVLERILDTPISPELLPPDEKGNIAQQTEDLVGPYALHDFFLYYVVRWGFAPKKVFDLACIAFRDDFDRAVILKWLRNFYRRFFTQQFKRSCSPEGAAVGSVSLSPRGAWAMPSDAQSAAWLAECDALE